MINEEDAPYLKTSSRERVALKKAVEAKSKTKIVKNDPDGGIPQPPEGFFNVEPPAANEIEGLVISLRRTPIDTRVVLRTAEGELATAVPVSSPATRFLVVGDFARVVAKGAGWSFSGSAARSNELSRFRSDPDGKLPPHRRKQTVAANLDFVVIAASAKEPRFEPYFVDRYRILCEFSHIPYVVCVTKDDEGDFDHETLGELSNGQGITVVRTSSSNRLGIEKLKDVIRGKTVVFVGRSGAGKSTLTNAILGAEIAKTGEVSEKSKQGKHTTVESKAYEWDKDSFVIDTPGIRSLDLLEIAKNDLPGYFDEFAEFASECRYRDCGHDGEDESECGVKRAITEGKIEKGRYKLFLRLRKGE